MPGRPRRLTQPHALTFLVETEAYERLVEMLEAYRQEQPRVQMSDLMRQIIGAGLASRG
jgi:hypothetical protein